MNIFSFLSLHIHRAKNLQFLTISHLLDRFPEHCASWSNHIVGSLAAMLPMCRTRAMRTAADSRDFLSTPPTQQFAAEFGFDCSVVSCFAAAADYLSYSLDSADFYDEIVALTRSWDHVVDDGAR